MTLIYLTALMPDLTRFNGESTDYPVRICACDKYGIKKRLNNKSLGYLYPGDTVMIEIANDFVKEHVEKNTIIFSPILRNLTGRCLLDIFAVRYNSPLARRKLLRGELLDGLNFKIFLRAWYVIKPEGIVCEYFYDAIK